MTLGIGLGLHARGTAEVTPQLPAFSPDDIADLRAWYDAADASTITASMGAVSQWNDKSANGYNATQGTGANQPITGSRTVNGLNGLDFDGSTDSMSIGSLGSITNGDNTWFVAVQLDATASGWGISIPGGGSGRRMGPWFVDNASIQAYGGNSTASYITQTANFSVPVIVGARKASSALRAFTGTTLGSAVTSGNLSSTIGHLGSFAGSSQFLNGILCEVIVYARALTDDEANDIGAYLENKWGAAWTGL